MTQSQSDALYLKAIDEFTDLTGYVVQIEYITGIGFRSPMILKTGIVIDTKRIMSAKSYVTEAHILYSDGTFDKRLVTSLFTFLMSPD